jgi:hypothetical protein
MAFVDGVRAKNARFILPMQLIHVDDVDQLHALSKAQVL